jgi:hypothetical protein
MTKLAMQLLRECIGRLRSDSGELEPMAPFAYDADWEAWALDVDDLLAGREFTPRNRIMRLVMPQTLYRLACVFDPGGRRLRGKERLEVGERPGQQPAITLNGIWRVHDVLDELDVEAAVAIPMVRRHDSVLFITSVRPYRRHSIINPARTVLQYLRLYRGSLQ